MSVYAQLNPQQCIVNETEGEKTHVVTDAIIHFIFAAHKLLNAFNKYCSIQTPYALPTGAAIE